MIIQGFNTGTGFYHFVEENLSTELHAHPALELILAREGSFSLRSPELELKGLTSAWIAPNQLHALNASEATCEIIMVEPGWKVLEMLVEEGLIQVGEFWGDLRMQTNAGRIEAIQNWSEGSYAAMDWDDRVLRTIALIQGSIPDGELSLPALAREIALSPSRLRHIFKQETGISLQKFLIWNRLKYGVDLLLRKEVNLTTAALEAGFFDSAHFSRNFRKMLGINPIAVYNRSRIVQVSKGAKA